jgi:hypothetical protein
MTNQQLHTLRTALGEIADRKGPGDLTKEEAAFVVTCDLRAEVLNGGLRQYLCNSTGQHAALAAEALRKIGATELGDLLETTLLEVFGGIVSERRGDRQAVLEETSNEDLEEFDEAFYERDDELARLLEASAERISVRCALCGRPCLARRVHQHQGTWIGDECCWDERLRVTE